MVIQFGVAPSKSLSEHSRQDIAQVLGRPEPELLSLFRALEEILTAYSPEAAPLVAPSDRLDTVREDLKRLLDTTTALLAALGQMDDQTKLRVILGSVMTRNGGPPIGDFAAKAQQFRDLIETIDSAIAPAPGGRSRVDHLRLITYCCAIQYHSSIGKWPARRKDGVFRRMMDIVLGQIGLELPIDPSSNILKPAIDAAIAAHVTPPEHTGQK
jgi:hypothetical protein